jgi:hypothetical protein
MLSGKYQIELNMKPITKQLIIGAFILVLVTVTSLGIRHVRFSIHRARTVESPVIADLKPENNPAGSHIIDPEPEPQYVDARELDEEVPPEDYSEAKPSKSDYAKARGKKGLEKISLGENENLYIKDGDLWYVSEQPDGSVTKMQVQIDQTTGELNVIDISGGKSQGSQPVPMGDGYNIYITDEGQTWYVGDDSKSRVEVDDTTGEITILEQYGDDGDK